MKSVTVDNMNSVSGGINFGGGYQPDVQAFAPLAPAAPLVGRLAVAAGAGLGAFNIGADAIVGAVNRIDNLNNVGARLGEAAFNAANPNPLGQMVFNRADFAK